MRISVLVLAVVAAALAQPPQDVTSHYEKAETLIKQGDWDGAIAEYREILRLSPEIAENHFRLGMLLNRTQDSKGAISEFREALGLKPAYAEAHYRVGGELLNGLISAFFVECGFSVTRM
jgi:Flp pilus assembly protein TadD